MKHVFYKAIVGPHTLEGFVPVDEPVNDTTVSQALTQNYSTATTIISYEIVGDL